MSTNTSMKTIILAAALTVLCVSCGSQGKGGGDSAKASEGKSLFAKAGCQGCHKVDGVGGNAGPDLSHVGSRLPDTEWHVRHMQDPGKVRPGSAMPAFGSLPQSELDALAAYLVTLK